MPCAGMMASTTIGSSTLGREGNGGAVLPEEYSGNGAKSSVVGGDADRGEDEEGGLMVQDLARNTLRGGKSVEMVGELFDAKLSATSNDRLASSSGASPAINAPSKLVAVAECGAKGLNELVSQYFPPSLCSRSISSSTSTERLVPIALLVPIACESHSENTTSQCVWDFSIAISGIGVLKRTMGGSSLD